MVWNCKISFTTISSDNFMGDAKMKGMGARIKIQPRV
jgi:hypothetical protein